MEEFENTEAVMAIQGFILAFSGVIDENHVKTQPRCKFSGQDLNQLFLNPSHMLYHCVNLFTKSISKSVQIMKYQIDKRFTVMKAD